MHSPWYHNFGRHPVTKQICLFNHKGGVSKTTSAFNLGWILASRGKKVILVDCDPQCNLTGMFFGLSGVDDLESIYLGDGNSITNIRDGLSPAFDSKPIQITPVNCPPMKGQKNLRILPGHIGLSEYETTLGIAQELSGSVVTLQNLPGAMHHLFQVTASKYKADYILIDMSPSLGPVNQNILATSDYFLVPMAPDYFSVMALDSLSSVLPKWKSWANKASSQDILKNATYPLPNCDPKFLGAIIQRYRIRKKGVPAAAFQKWISDLNVKTENTLLPALRDAGMLLPEEKYAAAKSRPEVPLLQMSDFNGLIALSQKFSAPVFALTDDQLGQTGIVLERTKKSMHEFRRLFDDAATKIIALTK
ncbi:ParA family protein [Roseococcus microcysteis]|uniref:ParA family protein n=1 Tax=Roseococcus microcysteis TaxID=2771361 RepID=UPI001CC36CA0|nr:AAA family ATPase [Roseococcus microcysteis]